MKIMLLEHYKIHPKKDFFCELNAILYAYYQGDRMPWVRVFLKKNSISKKPDNAAFRIYVSTNMARVMLTIQLPGVRHSLLVDSIVWLEGEANYTRVHCLDGSYKMITQPLLWFERKLGFVRIHRSAIVNPQFIAEFWQKKSRAGWVKLTNGQTLPVSRSRLEATAAQFSVSERAWA